MLLKPDFNSPPPEKQSPPTYIAPRVIPEKSIGQYINRPIGDYSTYEDAYDPWAITNGIQVKKYGYTAQHPQVATPLKMKCDAPFWTEYNILPQNDYEKYPEFEDLDKEIIDSIYYQMDRMEYSPFEQVLKSINRDRLVYGFSVSEIVYDIKDGIYCVNAIKTHSPFHFDFYVDKGFELDRIYYNLDGTSIERQMLYKFIVVTNPYLEHGRYYGSSELKSIYFDVEELKILEELYIKSAQRLSIKPILYWYGANKLTPEEVDQETNALYNMDSGSLILLPSQVDPSTGALVKERDVQVLEDRASWEAHRNIIDKLQMIYTRINRSLDMPDDLGFSVSNTAGSYSKSKEERSLREQGIWTDQKYIESFSTNKIIPPMYQFNYPKAYSDPRYIGPKLSFGSIEIDFDERKTDSIITMRDGGILHPKHDLPWMRETLGVPPATADHLDELGSIEDESGAYSDDIIETDESMGG